MAYDVIATVEGPTPPGHLEQEETYITAVSAQMRIAAAQVQFAWRQKARPSRITGTYEAGIEAYVVNEGAQIVANVVATAPYSEALEEGRRGFTAAEYGKKFLKIPTDPHFRGRNSKLSRNKGFFFVKGVRAATGRYYGRRTFEETIPKVEGNVRLAADEIVAKIAGRRGGL